MKIKGWLKNLFNRDKDPTVFLYASKALDAAGWGSRFTEIPDGNGETKIISYSFSSDNVPLSAKEIKVMFGAGVTDDYTLVWTGKKSGTGYVDTRPIVFDRDKRAYRNKQSPNQ